MCALELLTHPNIGPAGAVDARQATMTPVTTPYHRRGRTASQDRRIDSSAPSTSCKSRNAATSRAVRSRTEPGAPNAALCPAVDTVSLTDTDLEATLAVNIRAPTC